MISTADNKQLETLTEKIYQEGVQKAENEAQQILGNAKKEGEEIVAQAEEKAAVLIENAKKEAAQLKKNTEANLQLASNQMISHLKSKVTTLIAAEVLEKPVKAAFTDQEFLQSLLLAISKKWSSTNEFDVFASSSLKAQIDQGLANGTKHALHDLALHVDQHLESGFRIMEKGATYQISFTDQGFIELFKTYLRENIQTLLFDHHE